MRIKNPISIDWKKLEKKVYDIYLESKQNNYADFVYKFFWLRRLTLDSIIRSNLIVQKQTYNKLKKKMYIKDILL